MLYNADSTYTATATAHEGDVFYYREGKWTNPNADPEDPPTPPIEAVDTPDAPARGKVIIEQQTIYILDAQGRKYTLLGARIG